MPALSIFGAALLVWLAAAVLGRILLRPLCATLTRLEFHLFALLAGMGALSLVIFAAASLGLPAQGYLWLTLAIPACGIWFARQGGEAASTFRPSWIFVLVWLIYAGLYLTYALAPEVSSDGGAYHLGLPNRYLREGQLSYVPTNMYGQLSQGLEMVFLPALAIGGHPAAALQHWIFLAAMPWLIAAYAARFALPKQAGWAAGILVFASPVAGIAGSSAYNDLAVMAVLFGIVYAMRLWEAERRTELLALAGALAGFAYAIKYTACLGLVYAFVHAVIVKKRGFVRAWLIVGVAASLSILPWVGKNWIHTGNPVVPFFNEWFPNEVVDVEMEKDYRRAVSSYPGLKSKSEIPWAVTVDGYVLQGMLGPVFLLAPLGLLALGSSEGRRLLLPALLFALPYAANVGTRFLLPALPFLALALCLLKLRWLAPALAVIHAVLSWPSVIPLYANEYAWRIPYAPWEFALGLKDPQRYLHHWQRDIWMADAINRHVRPGERVFSSSQTPDAYTHADMHTAHLSRRTRAIRRLFWMAYLPGQAPIDGVRFWFPEERVQRICAEGAIEGVFTIRVFDVTEEIPARVERWPRPCAVLEGARRVSRVEVQHAPVPHTPQVRLVAQGEAGGAFREVSDRGEKYFPAPLGDPRPALGRALREEGYQWIAFFDRDYAADRMRKEYAAWGMDLVETTPVGCLYRVRLP